ncbi:hypothetical protein SDC9_162209 [bioreactor metagenome]|uniref:Dockerin domain-containing protein n=1 Tax=bioreactor metagenome TaxID=1076179 RepID=A0A645FLR7_9ZZZZ
MLPDGQEVFLSLEFTVKDGATAGDAVVYIDANFQRDIYNRTNPLHFIRAKDANSVVQFDTLAGFGATIDVAGATATVEIVEFAGYEITFDANGGVGGEVQTVAEGDLPVAPTVTRAGFIFLGWDPAIVAAAADATYTAQWGLLGDVNFDGNVTVADALLALRYTTGEATLTAAQILVADVNRDTFVTVADALMILRYTTGEVTEFPQ